MNSKLRSKNVAKGKQIIGAAITLFTEKGYAQTSMVEIAKQADVSKQTVYSHFGSKDELFSEAISQKCESSGLVDFSDLDINDVYQTLISIGQRFFVMITSKEAIAVHRICAFESRAYPQLSQLFFKAGPERLTDELSRLFDKMNSKGLLSIDNTKHAASQFLNMMKGEAWMRIEFNVTEQLSQQEVAQYMQDSVQFFMRGYAPKSS